MREDEYDKYLYRFSPMGTDVKNKQTEILGSHSKLFLPPLGDYKDEAIKQERRLHRRVVGERLTQAIYGGWVPYLTEWWEGTMDDHSILRDYFQFSADERDYHFYTKIYLTSLYTYPMRKRNAAEDGLTFAVISPERLT